jgi:asparagine synthase (glutamine-hydrolysing)
MSTLKPLGLPAAMFDSGFAPMLDSAAARAQSRPAHPVTHAAFEEIPWHLFGTMAAGRSQLTFRTPYMDNEIVKLAFRAPAHLRHTPEPALRLIHDSDAGLAVIPTDRGLSWGQGKLSAFTQRLFCGLTFKLDYWHKEGLPDALSSFDSALGSLSHIGLLGLHKFLPYRAWFRRELSPYLAQVISDGQTRRMPYWNSRFLDTVVRDHASGRHNRIRELHAILTLEAVQRTLVSDSAYRAPAAALRPAPKPESP